jgi:RNA polymerase sigma-70 factor (ECF subfamily)
MRQFRNGRPLAAQGHFRRFLLAQLNAFLAADWRDAIMDEPAADLTLPPLDLEPRYQRDNDSAISPEQAYERSFALEVLNRALKRLHSEARRTGHVDMYEALKAYLAQDPGPGEYEALARRLKSRPLALVVALKRLRQRFRELVGEELADTVTSAEDLATEQQALHTVLRELH